MNKAQPKYRPVLTITQILHILKLAKTESPLSNDSISVITTLAPFQAKIENAGLQAAYTPQEPKPKVNSLEALGELSPAEITPYNKEEYWQRCYNKYSSNPVSCSLEEIHAAKEHMYLNDMMSDAELAEFEQASDVDRRDSNG